MIIFCFLGVGPHCCSILCQFWLCEEAQCVYLRRHLGSPSSSPFNTAASNPASLLVPSHHQAFHPVVPSTFSALSPDVSSAHSLNPAQTHLLSEDSIAIPHPRPTLPVPFASPNGGSIFQYIVCQLVMCSISVLFIRSFHLVGFAFFFFFLVECKNREEGSLPVDSSMVGIEQPPQILVCQSYHSLHTCCINK